VCGGFLAKGLLFEAGQHDLYVRRFGNMTRGKFCGLLAAERRRLDFVKRINLD
jgi:hypothetical protein